MIARYTLVWSGFIGGPGYTNLYAAGSGSVQSFADGARKFMADSVTAGVVGASLPANVRITPNDFVEQVDEATGELLGTLPVSPPALIQGFGTGGYSAVAGACVNWKTGGIVSGRRVRGRTFFVPLHNSCFQNDGTLEAAFLTTIRAAASLYVASTDGPCIWHRPVGGTGGSAHDITVATVSDKSSFLSSRRD